MTCTQFFQFVAAAAVFAAAHSHAVQRTHVSAAIGSDANTVTNCTPIAPCRSFQAAMSVTDLKGEVVVLDSGGYGAVTITQSVSLIAPTGVYAGISVFPGANGVIIATAGVEAVLNGITLNGQGGETGIVMTNGTRLSVENCTIANFLTSAGIGSGISVSTPAQVRIRDTVFRNNGTGISLSGSAKAAIDNVKIYDSKNDGIFVNGSVAGSGSAIATTANISNATVAGGGFFGVDVRAVASGAARVSIIRSSITDMGFSGVYADTSGGTVAVAVSATLLAGNTFFGLHQLGGAVLQSLGNNTNRSGSFGLITTVPLQ